MRKVLLAVALAALALAALALPALAAARTWQGVALVDQMCLNKVKADPNRHPTSCLIKCADSGYGILTADGTWLKLDKAGNEKALAALKATAKKNHIRVNVTGELSGEEIAVTELTIAK